MLGHANKDMRSLYTRGTLKSIQDKLDRHVLGGDTYEEAKQKVMQQPDYELSETPRSPADILAIIGKTARGNDRARTANTGFERKGDLSVP